ncbi:hypothetical protein NA57DRAFT_77176 [Rhizodiscina lignyota]|uniref:Uncharacterized protein n=1 Tax=Rhizodiscina lignyota TaxID=1504668 RepID=A0A9P4ICM7_9PEZI|nr:hypothetical protein NA57DRAFT_77176 [Rhizodiscina lignyota]
MDWQSGAASTAFLAGTEIQGLIVLNHLETYTFERWHGTLIVIAITLICGIVNSILAKTPFPGMVRCNTARCWPLRYHDYLAGPHSQVVSPRCLDTGAGWGSTGLLCLIGTLAPTTSIMGSDAAAHMSEELLDASHTLPQAMLATLVINGTLGFVMLVTFVPPGWDIPLDCVLITVTIQILLSLTNIGSTIAFNQVVSWGPTPVLDNMNWSILMYGGVIVLALVWFALKGCKIYVGSVGYVRKNVEGNGHLWHLLLDKFDMMQKKFIESEDVSCQSGMTSDDLALKDSRVLV